MVHNERVVGNPRDALARAAAGAANASEKPFVAAVPTRLSLNMKVELQRFLPRRIE